VSTINQLKTEAKRRGLTPYSKLNKAQLIDLLNPLNEPEPETNVPVLTPKPAKKMERVKQYAADKISTAKKHAKYKFTKFINRLLEDVPLKPKVIDTSFEHVKKCIIELFPKKEEPFTVKEIKASLNKFTVQLPIAGRDNFNADSFMDRSRPLVIKLLEKNREVKFKMVLHCIMEKTNIKTGEVESHLKAFHSEIEINLESTDVDEIYSEMTKTILERLPNFQKSGSNWIFSRHGSITIVIVIQL